MLLCSFDIFQAESPGNSATKADTNAVGRCLSDALSHSTHTILHKDRFLNNKIKIIVASVQKQQRIL